MSWLKCISQAVDSPTRLAAFIITIGSDTRGDANPPRCVKIPAMSLSAFHPVIQRWFRSRFDAPTEAQAAGWPAIAQGRHTLIAAPTGSGKTLTAFLTCIDQLARQGMDAELPDATQVVYVSPLKALSNDIQKNLAVPLEEIAALAEENRNPDTPDNHGGAHRRHAGVGAAEAGQAAAAHPHHHPRVACTSC